MTNAFKEVHESDDNDLSSEHTLLQFSYTVHSIYYKVFGAIPEVIS